MHFGKNVNLRGFWQQRKKLFLERKNQSGSECVDRLALLFEIAEVWALFKIRVAEIVGSDQRSLTLRGVA